MTDREPLLTIHQPPAEDLANALMIAESWAQQGFTQVGVAGRQELVDAFASVARLLRHALDGLGEPNAAAIDAARPFVYLLDLPYFRNEQDVQRVQRDCAAAILHAHLRGSGSRGEPT